MEELFPSEIARLVLGYLKENKCEKSWKVFLEESSNLHEYYELYKMGKMYPTNVNGKSLLDILSDYSTVKKNAEDNFNNEFTEGTFKDKCKIILEDIVKDAAEHVLLKYFPSVSDKHCKTDSSAVNKAISTSELRGKRCIEYGNAVKKSRETTNNDHTPETSTCNSNSNAEVNVNYCNVTDDDSNVTNEPCEQQYNSGVNVASHGLIESSESGSIYLHEIIKVEKDNDTFSALENSPKEKISDINCDAAKQNKKSNSFSECYNDLNSSKKNSKIVVEENQSDVHSTSEVNKNVDNTIVSKQITDSMEVEIIETVKLEPDSGVNSYENETTGENCIQNSSIIASQDCRNVVEISQTAVCDTQSTTSQFSNLVNNISFSSNQSGFTLQTTPFSNQQVRVSDLAFSSVPTYILPNYSSNTPYMQNNAQYSFVINTSSPWEETPVNGFSLNLPSIQQNNIGPVLTSVDSIRNDSTPSISTVCVNNTLNPSLTPVEQVIGRNNLSATGINTLSNSTSTAVDTTASGVPLNVSGFENTAGTVHTKSNSGLIISNKAKSKSKGKVTNKQTSGKKAKGKKIRDELLSIKEIVNEHPGQVKSSRKVVAKKSKKKLVQTTLESGKNTNRSPNNAKMTTRRKNN